jgi:NAD(P)-dependent dehydrogenase (short-subunit alcohol dehydrogenase family)
MLHQPSDLLADKTVIITGAGQGIGRALACYLAAQGANLVINDLDSGLVNDLACELNSQTAKDGTLKVIALAGSVSDWLFAERLIATAVSRFGRLDGLINNAGLHYSCLPWQEEPLRLKTLLEVNVLGALYCGSQALKQFVGQGFGALINLSSGAHLGVAEQGAYCASKGAIASLTYSWALDARAYGVRVNAVAPLAQTRMIDSLPSSSGGLKSKAPPAQSLAPLFGYLLCDASAHITGQVIRFNGRDLSLLNPPTAASDYVSHENWQLSDIIDAFEQSLSEQLKPVGLLAAEYVPPDKNKGD